MFVGLSPLFFFSLIIWTRCKESKTSSGTNSLWYCIKKTVFFSLSKYLENTSRSANLESNCSAFVHLDQYEIEYLFVYDCSGHFFNDSSSTTTGKLRNYEMFVFFSTCFAVGYFSFFIASNSDRNNILFSLMSITWDLQKTYSFFFVNEKLLMIFQLWYIKWKGSTRGFLINLFFNINFWSD